MALVRGGRQRRKRSGAEDNNNDDDDDDDVNSAALNENINAARIKGGKKEPCWMLFRKKTLLFSLCLLFLLSFALGVFSPFQTTTAALPGMGDGSTAPHMPLCISQACIDRLASNMARTWSPKPWSTWCRPKSEPMPKLASDKHTDDAPQKRRANNDTGILLVKVPKSASSTITGLFLRIAHRHQCGRNDDDNGGGGTRSSEPAAVVDQLAVQWQHQCGSDANYAHRNVSQTLLVAPLRQAHKRALSSVYFHAVTLQSGGKKRGASPSYGFLRRQLERQFPNFSMNYTRLERRPQLLESGEQEDVVAVVNSIIHQYDFLLVTEELEASLIVLGWITGLPFADLLVISAKRSSPSPTLAATATSGSNSTQSYYFNGRRCVPLVPPLETNALREYFASEEWRTRQIGDILLHAVANASLYKTIQDQIGWAEYYERLEELRRLQMAADEACAQDLAAAVPCNSVTGEKQVQKPADACYTRDFGCGYQCYDRFVQKVT